MCFSRLFSKLFRKRSNEYGGRRLRIKVISPE